MSYKWLLGVLNNNPDTRHDPSKLFFEVASESNVDGKYLPGVGIGFPIPLSPSVPASSIFSPQDLTSTRSLHSRLNLGDEANKNQLEGQKSIQDRLGGQRSLQDRIGGKKSLQDRLGGQKSLHEDCYGGQRSLQNRLGNQNSTKGPHKGRGYLGIQNRSLNKRGKKQGLLNCDLKEILNSEEIKHYDIPLMEARAERLSDMDTLRRRAARFEEFTANEFVQVTKAKEKNKIYYQEQCIPQDVPMDEDTLRLDKLTIN